MDITNNSFIAFFAGLILGAIIFCLPNFVCLIFELIEKTKKYKKNPSGIYHSKKE